MTRQSKISLAVYAALAILIILFVNTAIGFAIFAFIGVMRVLRSASTFSDKVGEHYSLRPLVIIRK